MTERWSLEQGPLPKRPPQALREDRRGVWGGPGLGLRCPVGAGVDSVSYTHLTLPTICSV
eukprot:13778746-Alexandrium_andersonii.AAC.1